MPRDKQTQRVKRLERKFQKASEAIREFEEENHELLGELRNLAAIRDACMQELMTAIRETRIAAAGVDVTIVPKREFDGEFLYDYFTEVDEDMRDKLVTVKYVVDSKVFDSMQKLGHIDGKIGDKAITDVKEEVRLLHQPKPFQLG